MVTILDISYVIQDSLRRTYFTVTDNRNISKKDLFSNTNNNSNNLSYRKLILGNREEENKERTSVIENRKREDVLIKITNAVEPSLKFIRNGSISSRSAHDRYIFAFSYWEQLSRATENLLSLASFAKQAGDRKLILPLVQNSLFTMSLYGSPFSEYFDVRYLNSQLASHGYGTLAEYTEFTYHCKNGEMIMLYFIYSHDREKMLRNAYVTAINATMGKSNSDSLEQKLQREYGVAKCELRSSLWHTKIGRTFCVDSEVARSVDELERRIFQGAECVGITEWRGVGEERTYFSLPPSAFPLTRFDLNFNPHLRNTADAFVSSKLEKSFTAIHFRSEFMLMFGGVKMMHWCIRKLSEAMTDTRETRAKGSVFLSSDISKFGSSTLNRKGKITNKERFALLRLLTDSLPLAVVFEPSGLVTDKGSIAIIELNIAAASSRLFVLGGGSFQSWVVDAFLKRNGADITRLFKICTQTQMRKMKQNDH